jgi:hypothetical protein
VPTSITDLIQYISHPDTFFDCTRDTVKLPWDIPPHEYLRFAQQDIQATDRRSIVNALSNAKRALECQLDSLILAFQMRAIGCRWNVPKKLAVLNRSGVIAPRVLAKINRHRNEMEHEYACPAHDVTTDFVDVVELFLEATKAHIYDRHIEYRIDNQKISRYGGLVITLRDDGVHVRIDPEGLPQFASSHFVPDDETYCDLLAALLRGIDPTS